MCISGYFYLRAPNGNYLGTNHGGHDLEMFEAQKSNCRFWQPPLFSWDGEYLVYEGAGKGHKRVLHVDGKIRHPPNYIISSHAPYDFQADITDC